MNKEAIYGNYRASLRAQRKTDRGQGRTAARKQIALKQTADRFNVPMGTVKAVVRELDQLNGISHEHPENYKFELAFGEVYAQAKTLLGTAPCTVCNLAYESDLVRPRFPKKLDLAEGHMVRYLQDRDSPLQAQELPGLFFQGLPRVEDFIQLCYMCKLNNLGITFEENRNA